MTRAVWNRLLDAVRDAYVQHPGLTGFAPFPDDITEQPVEPFLPACADWFRKETALIGNEYRELRDALLAAASLAKWRETYKNTDIGSDFMDRVGCYSIIGTGGAFMSEKLWAWVVYMPSGLYYPWHHHPGEEMYMVLDGSAEFLTDGAAPRTLGPGEISQHASNQPHAMQTFDAPVLALVAWRNGFDTPPVLTKGTA